MLQSVVMCTKKICVFYVENKREKYGKSNNLVKSAEIYRIWQQKRYI